MKILSALFLALALASATSAQQGSSFAPISPACLPPDPGSCPPGSAFNPAKLQACFVEHRLATAAIKMGYAVSIGQAQLDWQNAFQKAQSDLLNCTALPQECMNDYRAAMRKANDDVGAAFQAAVARRDALLLFVNGRFLLCAGAACEEENRRLPADPAVWGVSASHRFPPVPIVPAQWTLLTMKQPTVVIPPPAYQGPKIGGDGADILRKGGGGGE